MGEGRGFEYGEAFFVLAPGHLHVNLDADEMFAWTTDLPEPAEPRRAAGAPGRVRAARASGRSRSGRRSCWRRWRASRTTRSARCAARFGAGLYVCEMITARGARRGQREDAAARRLRARREAAQPAALRRRSRRRRRGGRVARRRGRVDHIDMNFGCPVRKVTRRGGGAAIPVKPRLLRDIVRAAVRARARVPVTIKFRIGIDDELLTFLDAGRIARGRGLRRGRAARAHGRAALRRRGATGTRSPS